MDEQRPERPGVHPSPEQAQAVAVLACATVIEEMQPHIPEGVQVRVLDFGLHIRPAGLKAALQAAIDELAPAVDVILLGYGLCSQAVVGLVARDCTLVVPRAVPRETLS